jgi:hypothetical protein
MTHSEKKSAAAPGFMNLRFWIPVLLLTVSALALRPGLEQLSERYSKQPAVLQKRLQDFDITRLPSFQNDWEVVPATEFLGEIGTEDVILIKLKRKNSKLVPTYLGLFVTYYNQPGDKVPHTPDVCARQGGAVLSRNERVELDLPETLSAHSPLEINLLRLEEPVYDSIVLFFFSVEGQFKAGRNQARWAISKPGNRHTYFSKIEVIASFPAKDDTLQTEEASIDLCCQLLCEALPILVNEHFPSADQLGNP